MKKLTNVLFLQIFILCLANVSLSQTIDSWKKLNNKVVCHTQQGQLVLTPLTEVAIRVAFAPSLENSNEPSWILTEKIATPQFNVVQRNDTLIVSCKAITAKVHLTSGIIRFYNKDGKLILSEAAQGRLLAPATIQGQPTYIAQQKFATTQNECIYGTGQFQDGFLNIKGLTRRLTQVNTQIAIPYIYSSKGYGLLWHNYGLTDFNPADSSVVLQPQLQSNSNAITVNVTGTNGIQKEVRTFTSYAGTFTIKQQANLAFLLDVGQKMARMHSVQIDGKEVMQFSNYWLPPTASTIVNLTPGEHKVLVQCEKNDLPKLYYRTIDATTTFKSPVAKAIDYVVFAGSADEAIKAYRQLSGRAPLMPKWAFGYIHCRERFRTQDEIISNTLEFRKRQLPLDVIVQDWQYWGKYGWNAMKFDEKDYPNPAKLVSQLHGLNTRLMLSVWSKVDPNCEVGKEMTQNNYYIPGTQWVDFFNPDAAACYWKNFSNRLLKPYQIDAWWQDATEPENDDLKGRWVNKKSQPGEYFRNMYPLLVTKTVYEGSRIDAPNKRVFVLTRSAFPGQQRYAAATWSGDIGSDWETLRRQIPAGLNYSITGLPYWTTDCGGFFRPNNQYADTLYHERFLRWLQFATFCPLQRVHGFVTDTEFWRFGSKVETEARRYLQLRYQLLPYIYSAAADVTFQGATIMRPLVMDFPTDSLALAQQHTYMFGKALLVAPVLAPAVRTWSVYLPKHQAGWYDFWTSQHYTGGNTVQADAAIQKIPLYVKAGSILPLAQAKQHTEDTANNLLELRIYTGANAVAQLYTDDGCSYQYEKGAYATLKIEWNQAKQLLSIGKLNGTFNGMKKETTIKIVWIDKASGNKATSPETLVQYKGNALFIKKK